MTIFNVLSKLLLFSILGCTPDQPNPKSQLAVSQSPTVDVFEGKIMQSLDHGKTWTNISDDLPKEIDIQSIHSSAGYLYLGSTDSDVYINVRSPQTKWLKESLKEASIYTSDVKGYAVTGIFETQTAYFANVIYNALYMKRKNAKLWQPIKLPTGLNVVSDVAEDTNGTIYISGQYGIYQYKNVNNNWQHIFKMDGSNR